MTANNRIFPVCFPLTARRSFRFTVDEILLIMITVTFPFAKVISFLNFIVGNYFNNKLV